MSAEDIEYMDDYKEFQTKESALDWLDNYLSLDERNNLIKALQQEPRKGHWTYIRNSEVNGLKIVECSECGKRTYGSGNYCPNCGADMRGDENE